MSFKIAIYISAFCWGTLYANPSVSGFGSFEPIAVKFLIIGAVAPFIAIYMLYRDENARNPKKSDIVATVLISMFLVWFGYEVSAANVVPVYLGLIISFFLGLFSLNLIMTVKKKLFEEKGLFERIFKELGNWIARSLGSDGKE
ncbi:hypothetical protein [Aequorivita echinoideorum]|uniref:Uncharacterized protein n=1 Tax=Aequorivita echinoideorum TaxID=1549647 RepID=A0ABS5S373_9FLAO|nr:hypothetical protein [Aequorivita echinoideorum]MBT0607646.1 hypothetical protein [Aequorivita echinoideorum]